MDDGLVTNNVPLVAIDKQSFCLSNGDFEHQAGSSGSFPSSLSVGNNSGFKKNRLDEGDFWHGANPCRTGPWRSPSVESCQVQPESPQVQVQLKHQASGSGNFPGPLSVGNSSGFKKSRLDEGDFWQGANPYRRDTWRSPTSVESCQVQLEHQTSGSGDFLDPLSVGNSSGFKKGRRNEGEFWHGANPCRKESWRSPTTVESCEVQFESPQVQVQLEHQASSSGNFPVPLSVGNSSGFKKSRLDEGGFWHGANPCRKDSWRSPTTVESCQAQVESPHVETVHGIQRPKRQSCTSLMQGKWDVLYGIPGTLDESGLSSSRVIMGMEGSLLQSAIPGISGLSNVPNKGHRSTDFDFIGSGIGVEANNNSCFTSFWPSAGNCSGEFALTSGSNLEDENRGSWSETSASHLGVPRLGNVGSDLVCHSDGSNREEKYVRNLIGNSSGTPPRGTVDCQITNFQNVRAATDSLNSNLDMNQDLNVAEGSCGLGPNLSSYSSFILQSEGEMPPLLAGCMASYSVDNSSRRVGQSHRGRRGSYKRKSSTSTSISGSLLFCSPESSGRSDIGHGSSISGAEPTRLDTGDLTCASGSVSAGHIWEAPQNRAIVLGIDKENAAALSGVNDGGQRSVRIKSTGMQPEQNLSQFHAPFSRNTRRSLSVSQSHTRSSRRFPSVEQPVESNDSGAGSSSDTPMLDAYRRSGTMFSQRNSDASTAGSWGRNISFSRRSNNHHGLVAPSRVPGPLESSQIRSLPSVPPNWLGSTAIDSRLLSQIDFDSANQTGTPSTSREINDQVNHAHTSQMGESTFVFAGIANSLSAYHLSDLVSTHHNRGSSQGCMFPGPTPFVGTNDLLPSSSATVFEVLPSPAAIYQGPHTSGICPSLFVGGHGEGILVSPLQSVLGMPLRGVHVLPTEGENRHRVFSEILAALEHARRSNELSFEEWVMLDPSVIFGGIDIHDQHSDMRLDVDNMSYEELLALEERIGNVSTGLSDETIAKCLRTSKYTSLDATVAEISQESEIKCSVCQEEYVEEEDLGRLECSHSFHAACIRQWLLQKNQCPVCKAAAYT